MSRSRTIIAITILTAVFLSCNNPSRHLADCSALTEKITLLNDEPAYQISVIDRISLALSDEKVQRMRTAYNAVYLHLIKENGISIEGIESVMDDAWISLDTELNDNRAGKIIDRFCYMPDRWNKYKKALRVLAQSRCAETSN